MAVVLIFHREEVAGWIANACRSFPQRRRLQGGWLLLALVFHREDGYLTKAPKQREPHPTWPSRSHLLEGVFAACVEWSSQAQCSLINC